MYYLARVVATESRKHTFLKIVRWKILISKRTCIVIRKSRPYLPSYSRRGLVQFRNCLILRMFWLFIPIPSDCLTKHSVRLSPPIKSKLSPDCSLDWPRVIGQHGQRRNHFSLHLYHHRHLIFAKTSGVVTERRGKNWPIADRRVPSNDPRNNCGTHFSFLMWRIALPYPWPTVLCAL